MTARWPGLWKTLCAALAVLTMLAASPAAALDSCGSDASPCIVFCDDGDCGQPGEQHGDKGCTHCGYSHGGTGLSAPHVADRTLLVAAGPAYAPIPHAALTASPQSGPEHPPKA